MIDDIEEVEIVFKDGAAYDVTVNCSTPQIQRVCRI